MYSFGRAVRSLLPEGTDFEVATGGSPGAGEVNWDRAPFWPGDVFGVAAYVLDRSGAYQRIICSKSDSTASIPNTSAILVTDEDRQKATEIAQIWKEGREVESRRAPREVQTLWTEMCSTSWRRPLISRIDSSVPVPSWWHNALMLMMIADNAAEGIGYPIIDGKSNFLRDLVGDILSDSDNGRGEYSRLSDDPRDWINGWPHNWTYMLNEAVACVVPKSMAPEVGCTLRALSHNLALAPSAGEARASWWMPKSPPSIDEDALNLLLVPFPFRIPASSFKGEIDLNGSHVFDVNQNWLPKGSRKKSSAKFESEFIGFIEGCIKRAKRQVGIIHGVIFPELALNKKYFSRVSALAQKHKIRILISGVSESQLEAGNQVVAEVNFDPKDGSDLLTVRQKHHRWKLDAHQIRTYALADTLNPRDDWWEKLRVAHRSIDVVTLSETSTFTTLVCEDLARIDPCQRLIRAIGPSLIVALLMDGPQLKNRWPARYATVLADDPGASVLTLTSMGLISRSEDNGFESNRVIGLWKDRNGEEVEIKLPTDAQAMLVTLRGSEKQVVTMDGRKGPKRTHWSLAGRIPIRCREGEIANWILDGQPES